MYRKRTTPIAGGQTQAATPLRFRLVTLIATVLVLLPYTISYGDPEAHFVLVNRTRLFLHVIINNKSYAYIAPGGAADHEVSSAGSLIVDVAYSPGQGSKGYATKTVEVIWTDTRTASRTNDCSDNHSNTCTESSTSSVSSTLTVDPPRWDVTAADLAPVDTLGGQP